MQKAMPPSGGNVKLLCLVEPQLTADASCHASSLNGALFPRFGIRTPPFCSRRPPFDVNIMQDRSYDDQSTIVTVRILRITISIDCLSSLEEAALQMVTRRDRALLCYMMTAPTGIYRY
jgi:hypothetical protein